MWQPTEIVLDPTGRAISMIGTFRWEMEYEALTGGAFEEALLQMDTQLTEYRNAAKEKRVPNYGNRWAGCTFDLFFSVISKWRQESGWDRDHYRDGDELKPEKERGPYLDMADSMGKAFATEMQRALIRMLYAYTFDPGRAAGNEVGDLRPETSADESPSATA